MCRKLRTTLPITCSCLNHIYIVPEKTKVRERDKSRKLRQENKYNVHHRATPLPQLCRGSHVWVPDHNSEAEVVEETNSRPYRVETPDGSYRRNRTALRPLPVQYENNEDLQLELDIPDILGNEAPLQQPSELDYNEVISLPDIVRHSGRHSSPPDHFDPSWT